MNAYFVKRSDVTRRKHGYIEPLPILVKTKEVKFIEFHRISKYKLIDVVQPTRVRR